MATLAASSVTRRSTPARLVGERETHPAGRAVADEADGVDRLAGAPRGDDDMEALQRARLPE